MSRRPLQPPLAQAATAVNRMAPGGRLWSESQIRPLWRPVGEAGVASAEMCYVLRALSFTPSVPAHPPTLVGGSNALYDGSDATYLRVSIHEEAGTGGDWGSDAFIHFEAVEPAPGFVPRSMMLTVRGRIQGFGGEDTAVVFHVGGEITSTPIYPLVPHCMEIYWTDDSWTDPSSVPMLSEEWQTWNSEDNLYWTGYFVGVPTVEDMAAGLNGFVYLNYSAGDGTTAHFDIAEMSLTICNYPEDWPVWPERAVKSDRPLERRRL